MSQLTDILMGHNSFFEEDEMKPFSEEFFEKDVYDDICKFINEKKIDISKFRYIDKISYNLLYLDYESGVYITAMADVKYFEFLQMDERIKSLYQHQKNALEKEDYLSFYITIPHQLQVYDFKRRYSSIPKKHWKSLFEYIYTSTDFGFSVWAAPEFEKLFKELKKRNSCKDGDEELIIYRGVGEKSTPTEESHSWTTSIESALFFATRFGNGTVVYKAKVKKKDIVLDLRGDGSEEEVIIDFKDLYDVTAFPMIPSDMNTIVYYSTANDSKYQKYGVNFYDMEKYFSHDEHDKEHSARVLFYTLLYKDACGLTPREQQILAYASLYHDIGRFNNCVECTHGSKSVQLIETDNIIPKNIFLKGQNLEIAKAIIKYHCMDDSIFEEWLDKSNFENKERVLLLYRIFKDCDALDRVRFKHFLCDFKFSYLRLEHSRKLPLLVGGFFQFHIESLLFHDEEEN